MRARYVSLLLTGAIVAAAAVAAIAQPRDPAGTRESRDRVSGSDRAALDSPDPMDDCGGGDPGYGMRPGGRGPWAGRGGMWRGRAGLGFGGPGARLLRGEGPLADELKLSGTQREKLRGIGDELARSAIRNRADLELARLDLNRMVREDTPDRARIESQIDTIAKLRAEMMKAAVRARLDARSLLTPEQRKQLMEHRATRGAGRETGRGAGRGDWR